METPSNPSSSPNAPPTEARRGFVAKAATLLLGGAVLAVPALTGLIAWLNPLRQKSQAGQSLKLATLAALPEDGTPRKFPVIADRTDAWNRFPNEPIGAVFLRLIGEKQVEAYQVVCPHAGCSITTEGSGEAAKFFCPCHEAYFALDGKRLDSPSPSPCDMDTLTVEIKNEDEIWVKFENFETGTSQKKAKA